MTKVIPNQFPSPPLDTLVTPVGDLTLSALLWTSIGSAPAYQIFTGCIELLGGVLLLVPRLTMLGAMISLAAAIQVFVLNMTYDIGLKLVSLHLIVLALFLLAPDASRLVDFFRDRATAAPARPPLFRGRRANRIALAAQIAFGVYLLGMYAFINVSFWRVAGGGSPRSPLFGIWDVERLSVDGQVRPAYLNDYDRRWRRMIARCARPCRLPAHRRLVRPLRRVERSRGHHARAHQGRQPDLEGGLPGRAPGAGSVDGRRRHGWPPHRDGASPGGLRDAAAAQQHLPLDPSPRTVSHCFS